MRLGELGGRVGGRDREDTHAGLQRRLDSCAGIFDDETFSGSKEGWSGAAGVELSKREFIHRGIGLADGAFVRGHDEFESSLDGRSREGGENVFPSASRCDGQPVVPERSFDKPGHPGKKGAAFVSPYAHGTAPLSVRRSGYESRGRIGHPVSAAERRHRSAHPSRDRCHSTRPC